MNPERMRKQMWWLRKPKIISDVENNRACQAAKEFVSRLYNEDARIDVSLYLYEIIYFLKFELLLELF